MKAKRRIKISLLEENEGQILEVPRNPRWISDEKLEALERSLERSPELLEARPLIVYPLNNKYVILGGNMRLRALKRLGAIDVPCYVLSIETPAAKLREIVIADNNAFGQNDWEALKEWDAEELASWSFDLPDWQEDELQDFTEETNQEDKQLDDEAAEALLNDAIKDAAGEFANQFDELGGFSFITPHSARFNFIQFDRYGKEYHRYNSLAFHKVQFQTKGDNFSSYEGLRLIQDGTINPERLRFVCGDRWSSLPTGSLAFGGAKMPLDFPADLARDLINEFATDGKVLDPCAGWGGRLVGFLASEADEYEGVDASPEQVSGDLLIYDTFKTACRREKKVTITCTPFEKKPLQSSYFDMAITSPPYFDTEQYIGGEQSHDVYKSYEDWREGFYRTLIAKCFDTLKDGGMFCLQVGSQRYPLLDDGKKIASEIGFDLVEVRATEMKNNQTGTELERGEVVVILRKSDNNR
ncbi:MAG: ParB N-terminal domain-containing protein [Bacteroidaceae bacterium]|nr:ParB N-terminal domain-containing protein [Bacteroidaceae bacterium]